MKKMKSGYLVILLFAVALVFLSCKSTTDPDDKIVSAPVFSPETGTFSNPQDVSITCATSGAAIRYTTDGSDPTEDSAQYTSPIAISSTTTIKARAYRSGWTPSPVASATYTINAIDPEQMVFVPGGTFTMGRTKGDGFDWELPTHSVTLNSFYIGKYFVTQSEYDAIMGSNPTSLNRNRADYPVEYVSWYAALKYCNLRSMNEGLTPVYSISGSTNPADWGDVPSYITDAAWDAAVCNWTASGYRLPTEAEWEYAARGATNNPDYLYSGSDDIDAVAWYFGNSSDGLKPVGTKAPNGLGIYDMSGTLCEWCWDWLDRSYYSSSPASNPTGPTSGSSRVLRGGNYCLGPEECRIARRRDSSPDDIMDVGLRICRTGL